MSGSPGDEAGEAILLFEAAKKVLLVFALGLACGSVAAQTPSPTARLNPDDYLIGIEDRLRVFVWGEPDLSVEVQVRPDGFITVPLVNEVSVVGKSPEQVRRAVSTALAKYIREPLVTVIVEEINSYRVYFLGEINDQGVLNFYRPTTLLQGVAAAGGLTEFAKKEITLLRIKSGKERRINIDYKKLLAGDGSAENIYLEAGDTLLFR